MGRYSLRQCRGCGHRYLDAYFSAAQLRALYSDFYPRAALALEDYRPLRKLGGLAGWLDGERSTAALWVPAGSRVLDIGCGFGESLGYHKARGCDAHGVEADENVRRVAEQYGLDVHIGVFDPRLYDENSFDFVTMNQVVEHISDPQRTLSGVARVLRRGGTAILSTPNADGWGARVFGQRWIHWHAPYHLQFFTVESMRMLARQSGLKLVSTRTLTPSRWLSYQWLHLLTYPAPETPSRFWKPGLPWSRGKKAARLFLSLLHRLKLNHLVTRGFDALGLGDNRVYILQKP